MSPLQPIPFVVFVILVPALIAGLILLGVRRRPEAVRVVGALAIGAGFLFGLVASLGERPTFPPSESRHGMFFVALAAIVAGVLRAAKRVPAVVGWVALGIVAYGAPWLVLRNLIARWTPTETIVTLLVVGLATIGLVVALDAWAEKRRGASVPLVCWLVSTATAIAVGVTHSAIYAQFAGTLAAVFGAAVVFGWVSRDANFARGATLVFASMIATTCVACIYLSSLPRVSGLLLVYAPLAAVAVDRGRLSTRGGLRALAVQLAAVALVAAVALFLAFRAAAALEYGE